jgi:hypothetical protein
MKDRDQIEQAIYDKVVESFNMYHPADQWECKSETKNSYLVHDLNRKDGLHITYYVMSMGINSMIFRKPSEFKFLNLFLEKKLCNEIEIFLNKLKTDLNRKKDEDILNAMIDFFGLDVKKQRKDKLDKINGK